MAVKCTHLILIIVGAPLLLPALPSSAAAQYFGRNKIQYEDFDFSILETQHFDLYHYDRMSEPAVEDASRMAERWYDRYSRVFDHHFEDKTPLILYADQPDFQQTNTTFGFVSQSTGGFTEGLKDRVVMPLTETYAETEHVLGHELVHAFQFDIAAGSEGTGSLAEFRRLPLWFIEGMAEYLSLGRFDVHTAMWMRDAVVRNDLPTIDDLSSGRFFPYRFGHAFWAFVAGRYGDDKVPALFRAAGRLGIEPAIEQLLRIDADTLSAQWNEATRDYYGPLLGRREGPIVQAEVLLPDEDEDAWSLAPVLSPDGRLVVFLSQRGLFSIELFVADARTGEVLGELASTLSNPHFDAIAFLGSSGTWSPDGSRFAFVTYAEGDNGIAIADIADREVVRSLDLPEIGAVYDVAWSPDGSRIAFAGGAGGITDLYVIDLGSGRIDRLTEGPASELQPAWSPDGRTLAFTTDQGTETDFERLTFGPMGLGFLDVSEGPSDGEVRVLRPFEGVKHINPQYAPDGRSVYFISDREGYSDVYRLETGSGDLFQVTRVATGVSGITALAPALSVARESGRLAFSIFRDGGYRAYATTEQVPAGQPVPDTDQTELALAGALPPVQVDGTSLVASYLASPETGLPATPRVDLRPYDPDLSLDYIAPPTAGIGISRYGTAIGGSVGFFFSDMLGNHQLGLGVQANGTFKDLGGELIYVDQENRFNWGGRVGRTTYRSAFGQVSQQIVDGNLVEEVEVFLDRTYFTGGSVMAEYPFSLTQRIEGDVGFTRLAFDREIDRAIIINGVIVLEEEQDVDLGDPLNLGHASAAWVQDYSIFGFTSPVRGGRTRFEVGGNAGTLTFGNVLADFRRYLFVRPVTLAFRGFHLGRYGGDAESERLRPLFVGYPTLIRGYEAGSFEPGECGLVGIPTEETGCPVFDRLIGSRVAVANVELRVPVFGSREFGLLGGGFFPMELALFVDGATAWSRGESPEFSFETETDERVPVFSSGGSLRVNFFGAFIAEVYYAYPFQRPESGWRWGFQISPGW